MGFRSTFTTQDYPIHWPQWFRDKYAGYIWFTEHGIGPLHPIREAKEYMRWSDLPSDIQRAIDWGIVVDSFVLVYLHECGGITRCQIEKDAIKWSEPEEWRATEGVEHDYCYGCSDADNSPTPHATEDKPMAEACTDPDVLSVRLQMQDFSAEYRIHFDYATPEMVDAVLPILGECLKSRINTIEGIKELNPGKRVIAVTKAGLNHTQICDYPDEVVDSTAQQGDSVDETQRLRLCLKIANS